MQLGGRLGKPSSGDAQHFAGVLVLGAFAEELEADVPQVVTAVHVAGIGADEFLPPRS